MTIYRRYKVNLWSGIYLNLNIDEDAFFQKGYCINNSYTLVRNIIF